jgi:hypothetical protein
VSVISPVVELESPGWQRLTRPAFGVELSYPAVTPRGHAVERTEERAEDHRGDMERVHLTSGESRELYVEVARFRELAPQDEYRQHRAYLEQRFGADSVTALTETSLGERPAWAYAFRWDEGERAVLLLQVARDTYRIIYDPRSALNTQVIDTLTFAETAH